MQPQCRVFVSLVLLFLMLGHLSNVFWAADTSRYAVLACVHYGVHRDPTSLTTPPGHLDCKVVIADRHRLSATLLCSSVRLQSSDHANMMMSAADK